METGPIIPRAWVNELARLESLGMRGFIAGGAVRDLILGRQHKDVDLWLPQCYEDLAAVVAAVEDWRIVVHCGYAITDLLSIYEYQRDGETFNVIVTRFDTQDEIVGRFDFGISRAVIKRIAGPIVYDRTYPIECELVTYPEFREDMARKVFKVRHDHGAARTLARWERFKERYPDWTFEDQEGEGALLGNTPANAILDALDGLPG